MKSLFIKKRGASFSVPTVFVDRYMASADEKALKIYLYLLCHLNDGDISLDSVSNALNISVKEVELSLQYWDERKVINFINGDDDCSIEFLTLNSYDGPKISVSTDEDKTAEEPEKATELGEHPKYLVKEINATLDENKDVRDMFLIAEQLLGKPLNHNEMKIVYSFHDWLKLPTSVIVMLLEHCTSVKKFDLRYIEKVAITWAENGIDNFEKASIYIKGQAKYARAEKKVKRILQISGRDLTELETKFVKAWIEEYKVSESVVKQAYEITVMNTGKMNFKYMDAVLKNIISEKEAPKKDTPRKKTGFNNFSGEDNLNEFEKKMFNRRMNTESK